MKLLWIPVMAAACSACSVLPPEPLAHSNGFSPVFPVEQKLPALATGAIYNGQQSERFFGRGRGFRVGDVITVLLNESTQAARTQNGSLSRSSSNDVPTSAPNVLKGLFKSAVTLESNIKKKAVSLSATIKFVVFCFNNLMR